LYDWHTGELKIPVSGVVVGSAVETALAEWPDYEGELPQLGSDGPRGFCQLIMYDTQQWDSSKDPDVPDLGSL
jgi:hypothetical protein